MNFSATVSSKGQVTVPLEIRKRLGLEQGSRVEFVIKNGVTFLQPLHDEENPFLEYAGALNAFEGVNEINTWLNNLRNEGEACEFHACY